jgi:hypothetical protein
MNDEIVKNQVQQVFISTGAFKIAQNLDNKFGS